MIRENKPETGVKLFGINFADPLKKGPMTTLQQWERLDETDVQSLSCRNGKIRYPIKAEMEIPTSISCIAFPGKYL